MGTNQEPTEKPNEEEPLYRFSWRRFAVIAGSLLTLPLWAPWVKRHVGMHQMLLLIPFVVIFAFSIWCVSFMFPNRSIRRSEKQERE
jgi:Sec-independent protein secretion pathway component TatC